MAMDGSGVEIKVRTEVLDAKAMEVTTAITHMERLFESVQATVDRTKYYWIGEAGNLHRKAFTDQKDDIAELLKRLKEHPVDLQKIARTYETAEKEITQLNSQMSSNLID